MIQPLILKKKEEKITEKKKRERNGQFAIF
jgi:hypothetical protein